jgi:hypothetical protein
MDSEDPLIFRVGIFFYVIGSGAFLLFVVSDLAKKAEFDFLFMSLVMLGIGWMFRRGKAPPPSAGRFSWLNKQREERRNKKQGKQEAKKK